mmetsp:Transcript_31242/g.76213  ORF Transcript_31242/g.76213 Transcript_31242/m.76213 type:complete len:466 (-) Transcript_31242:111-1508(-)
MFSSFQRRKTAHSTKRTPKSVKVSEKGGKLETKLSDAGKKSCITKNVGAKTSKKRVSRTFSQSKIPPMLRGISIPGFGRSRSMNGGNRVSTPPPGFRPSSPFCANKAKKHQPRSDSPLPFHPDSFKSSASPTSGFGSGAAGNVVRFRGELSRMGSGSNLTMVIPRSSSKSKKNNRGSVKMKPVETSPSQNAKSSSMRQSSNEAQSAECISVSLQETKNKSQPQDEQNNVERLGLSGVSQIQFTEGKDVVKASALKQADLSGKHISDTVGENILKAFEKSSTEDLYLYCNQLSTRSCRSLATVFMTTDSIRSILLARNNISDEGVMQLAIGLRANKTVQTLGLDYNQIGNKGAHYLGEALKRNQTLRVLDLDGNQIGNDGAEALCAALAQNTSLKELGLVENCMGTAGVKEIQRVLSTENTTLRLVSVQKNPGTNAEVLQNIKSLLKRNKRQKKRRNSKKPDKEFK